jgi:hypothetical protein
LCAVLTLILMTAGGLGAGMLAVRSGQAEKVAQAVLGGLFVNALIGSVVTGFGINGAFTDQALRDAIGARDRLAARHLTGILEPVGFSCWVSTWAFPPACTRLAGAASG